MIVTIDGIPVFNAILADEECGMLRISLVDAPAVESNFLAFDKQKRMQLYRVADEAKRRVIGCVMRADFPIFRRDPQMGEFYMVFKPEVIRTMAEKYLLESRQNDVNLDHRDDMVVDGVQMVQYFIKDSAKGINPEGFDDIADGSLFAEFHIVNDEVWQAVNDGTYKGFSLEGIFDLQAEESLDDVRDYLNKLEDRFSKIFNPNDMSKVSRFFSALEAALVKVQMGSTTTDKGVVYWDGDEDLKEGVAVYKEDEEGNRVAADAGDYTTEDGKIIRVAEGVVAEIVDPRAEVAEEPEAEAETEAAEEPVAEEPAAEEPAEEPAAEEPKEEEEPKDENDLEKRLNDLEALVKQIADWLGIMVVGENGEPTLAPEDFRAQMSAIHEEIAKLAKTPAAAPAHEEFKAMAKAEATKDKGLNRLASYLK